MNRTLVMLAAAGILIGLAAGSALSYRSGKDEGGDFQIFVAPATICASAPGDSVTIHTTAPYSADAAASTVVSVDATAVGVQAVFADDRGQLVARVSADDVVAAAASELPEITLALVADGAALSDSEIVRIKD